MASMIAFVVLVAMPLCSSFRLPLAQPLAPTKLAALFSSGFEEVDIEKIGEVQWELLCRHHVGQWKGVQTG
jgi:hypothetical protein